MLALQEIWGFFHACCRGDVLDESMLWLAGPLHDAWRVCRGGEAACFQWFMLRSYRCCEFGLGSVCILRLPSASAMVVWSVGWALLCVGQSAVFRFSMTLAGHET